MMKRLSGIALIVTCLAGCDRPPAPTASTVTISAVALHFKVDGMTCDGCAKSIESEVAELPGVTTCKASHENGSLTVQTTDPAVEPKVIAAVSGLQFEIQRIETTPANDEAPADASNSSGETAQPAAGGH